MIDWHTRLTQYYTPTHVHETASTMVDLYKQVPSVPQIAKILHVNCKTVARFFKKHQIPMNDRRTAALKSTPQKARAATTLQTNPNYTATQLSRATGLSVSLASYYVTRFRRGVLR